VIRLSCSDYTWPYIGHDAAMTVVADLGFSGIDIGVFHEASHVALSSIRGKAHRRAEEIRSAADGHGLTIADVFLTADPDLSRLSPTSRSGEDQRELRKLFQDILEFAEHAGSGGVTLLPGVIDPGVSPQEAIERSAETLAEFVAEGAHRGLGVSVEPHVGSCIESPEATRLLLDECPGLMLTLDPSHYAYQGWTVPAILGLIDRTRHVQIRPARTGVMQATVAEDDVDLELFVSTLMASGYDGWVATEYVWMEKWDCNRVDNTSETFLLRQKLHALMSEGV
jgi:sugar phosphate isomerase/epimerase